MTSVKQIEANRLNALKSTGPRTAEGKQQSRQNALCHGLTAETVITALETAADYEAFQTTIVLEYQPRSATERELVFRLTSLLWRLRRATSIETGLFQIQADLMQNRTAGRRRRARLPEWYDELDVAATVERNSNDLDEKEMMSADRADAPETLAYCFMQVSRIQFASFDLLNRYETALWRQAAQIIFMLQSVSRR
jgi:hypothetical protein